MLRKLAIALLLFASFPAFAQQKVSVQAVSLAPSQMNVSVASATGLTIPNGANAAYVTCSAATNWRDDGTAPTSSSGQNLSANIGTWFAISLNQIQFISQSGADTCDFSYYKLGG